VETYIKPNYYSYLDRGSDEKQYNSPGVDLPIASIMRSKYGTYPEYHTSFDNLDFVSERGLQGSFEVYKKCIELIERNEKYKIDCLCEPQLGKRGLYPKISTKESTSEVRDLKNFIAYADGNLDLIEISDKIGVNVDRIYKFIEKLGDLLEVVE